MATRALVVQMWSGPKVVHRVTFTPADVDAMSDTDVLRALRKLGVDPVPEAVADRRDRLKGWPTQADLDAVAVAWLPWNDGVRPSVRIIETTRLPGRGIVGTAGAMPR